MSKTALSTIVASAPPSRPGYVPSLSAEEITEIRVQLQAAALAPSTVRSYERHIRDFQSFCFMHGANPLPASADTVAAFLTEYGLTHKPSTLSQVTAALKWWHEKHDLPSPTSCHAVRSVIDGHMRMVGAARRKKKPITTDQVRAIADMLDAEESPRAVRDKALLLVGYAGAFRRSELVALTFDDLDFKPRGLAITIRRSKTDQEGYGAIKPIAYGVAPATCPITALRAWMRELQQQGHALEGPVFRPVRRASGMQVTATTIIDRGLCDRTVARVVKERLAQIGIDDVQEFSGHSLRSGHVTTAGEARIPVVEIMQTTLHTSMQMIVEYTQISDKLANPSSRGLGL